MYKKLIVLGCAACLALSSGAAHAQTGTVLRVRPVARRAPEPAAPAPAERPSPPKKEGSAAPGGAKPAAAKKPVRVAAVAPAAADTGRTAQSGPEPAPVVALGTPVSPPAPAPRVEEIPPAPDTVVKAEAVPVVATAPKPAEAPAEKPAEKPVEKPAVAMIEVASGSVKFSGNVQTWYQTGGDKVTSSFRVRRTELKFAGELNPSARWTVMVDPSKALKLTDGKVAGNSLILQDAYVTFRSHGLTLDAGQMKLPLSREGYLQASSRLETVERALFISDGKLGLVRDLGFLVGGPLAQDISFQIGAFNSAGEGQNSTDSNEGKVVAGRLELKTALPGLVLGSSGAWSGKESDTNARRNRLGGDAAFTRGPLTLRSEVMRSQDGKLEGLGYYGLAAYRFGDVEAAARYDVWDRDTRTESAAADARERDYVAGLSYFFSGPMVKVQASYAYRTFGGIAPNTGLLLLNLQTAW